SGHIVFLDHNTTGDGLITALALFALLVEKGRPLSELRRIMRRLPQVLLNVRVAARRDVPSVPPLAAAIAKAERALGARGRVLVRYSGTEPLLRVMVEGEREGEIRDLAESIAAAARGALGESAGAEGITVHLREDRRHIQQRDVEELRRRLRIKLNLEMAVTDAMVDLALGVRPDDACFVPERREELTTEGGLDVVAHAARVTAA